MELCEDLTQLSGNTDGAVDGSARVGARSIWEGGITRCLGAVMRHLFLSSQQLLQTSQHLRNTG